MTLTAAASCLQCGPLPSGSPAEADKASAAHTRKTGHATSVCAEDAGYRREAGR